jgi:hypothetical protein
LTTLGITALNPLHFDESKEVEFLPPRFRPDAGETGAIRYRLAQPGIVRIYIRPRKRRFLAIRTLADWEAQQAGEHSLVWDGRDERGNVLNPALYCAVVESQPLRGTIHREHLPLDKNLHHEDMMVVDGKRVHGHVLHDVDKCRQLKVDFVAPAARQKLSGTCRLTAKVREDARGYGREVGHSARYYIDYLLLHEDKDVQGPVANWDWDTRNIPSGMHVLSVACCDHHDHMASDSIVVEIENP